MHGVALHRAGPDDRDLDDEVLEALRPRLRQRLHLGAALDLEHAHRVGRLDGPIHLGVVVRKAVEVDARPRVALDPVQGIADHAQRPEAEQVDLHQAELLDVLLVVLGHDPVGHGGALDRHEVDQRVRVTSMPPTWMPRWRGKPSISAQRLSSHCHRLRGA